MVSVADEVKGTGVRVSLERFEGPLDLLFFLIKRDEIDIYDIPIARVTEQYLEQIRMMQMLDLEVAGDFLVMAATLMRIKAKLLLPRPEMEEEEEEGGDPRDELVQRLLEYRRFKNVSIHLREKAENRLHLVGRSPTDVGEAPPDEPDEPLELQIPVDLVGLLKTFADLIERAPSMDPYEVILDEFTLEEKIERIEREIDSNEQIEFQDLFDAETKKMEVIVTFIAMLELLRLQRIHLTQSGLFGRIWIRRRSERDDGIPAETEA